METNHGDINNQNNKKTLDVPKDNAKESDGKTITNPDDIARLKKTMTERLEPKMYNGSPNKPEPASKKRVVTPKTPNKAQARCLNATSTAEAQTTRIQKRTKTSHEMSTPDTACSNNNPNPTPDPSPSSNQIVSSASIAAEDNYSVLPHDFYSLKLPAWWNFNSNDYCIYCLRDPCVFDSQMDNIRFFSSAVELNCDKRRLCYEYFGWLIGFKIVVGATDVPTCILTRTRNMFPSKSGKYSS